MATLKDVARLACVDVSTVSRALTNTSYVHPETKARIYAAVKELSYQPNVLAQGLRQGKRHTIGVVCPRLHMSIFAEIIQGIEREALRLGYATILCATQDDPAVEKQCLNRLRNGFVDGIILAGTGRNNRLMLDIKSSGIAVGQVVRQQIREISSVVADYENCAYEGVKYLAGKGCREIGFISGNPELAPYRERYAGYARALREMGLYETVSDYAGTDNRFDHGYRSAFDLLDRNPELDAIMAPVDIQGMGAMRALKERGIPIPQKVRVLSLTGHAIGGMLDTTMTSMEMPAYEMGEKAARMVIEEFEAPSGQKPSQQHLVFQAALVEREST